MNGKRVFLMIGVPCIVLGVLNEWTRAIAEFFLFNEPHSPYQ